MQLLTGDVLFCQRPLARLILEAGRDYLLAIKGNQPDLLEAAQTAFAAATPASAAAQSVEKSGRLSIRRLWWDSATAAYAREQWNFPGLRLLWRIDQELRDGAAITVESGYFACSGDPTAVTPLDLLAWVRGHWSVENSLHFSKDRWWDEDRHYLSRPGLAERWAVLTNAALAVLRVTRSDPQQPLRACADQLNRNVEQAIRLVTEEIT